MLRVVHYLNQFFGGLGGEEHAETPPRAVDGPVGPGMALTRHLGDSARVVRTLICGDNYFASHEEEATARLVELLEEAEPDLFVAGPAFSAGRYGIACAALCRAAAAEGITAVTGFSPRSPAVSYRRDVLIVPTGESAAGMDKALRQMAVIGLKRARGEALGDPESEGYLPHGFRRNVADETTGAARAVAMLHAKLAGQPFTTEIPLPEFKKAKPAPPVTDLSRMKLALLTSGGLVPKGNPDHLKSHVADRYGRYPLDGDALLTPDRFEAFHGGFYTEYVNADPHRLVPLDAVRDLAREGLIRDVYPVLFTIAGNGTYPEVAERMADEIAPELKAADVGGALITST